MKYVYLAMLLGISFINFCIAQKPQQPLSKKESVTNTKINLSPDSNTLYKDEDGVIISQATFFQKVQSREYTFKPVINDGRVSEMVLSPATIRISEKKPAPDFKIKTLQNESIHLDELKGKVVVLNFWFIACNPCVEEMDQLNELVKQYKDNDKVVFLALTFDDKPDVKKFLEKTRFDYKIVPFAKTISDKYGIITFPTHVVILPDGNIQKIFTGYHEGIQSDLKKEIEASLTKLSK